MSIQSTPCNMLASWQRNPQVRRLVYAEAIGQHLVLTGA
jgi:hypothetical protein